MAIPKLTVAPDPSPLAWEWVANGWLQVDRQLMFECVYNKPIVVARWLGWWISGPPNAILHTHTMPSRHRRPGLPDQLKVSKLNNWHLQFTIVGIRN